MSSTDVAPDTVSPDNLSPEALSPDNLSPETLSPDNLSPETRSPDNLSPEALSPDNLSPEALSPDNLSPETLSPDNLSPETLSPDNLSPDALSPETLSRRPKRADALRNYEKLIAAARDAFAAGGTSTSLEEIARRAQVGIGTLYRHFPTRQALLEAVYVEEVQALCQSAADLAPLPPWDALIAWLHRFVGYMATKRALADELLSHLERDAEFFRACRGAFYLAGEPLLVRAQQAGVVRSDTNFDEVIQMVSGIGKLSSGDPDQLRRILDIALDGLRPQPPRDAAQGAGAQMQ